MSWIITSYNKNWENKTKINIAANITNGLNNNRPKNRSVRNGTWKTKDIRKVVNVHIVFTFTIHNISPFCNITCREIRDIVLAVKSHAQIRTEIVTVFVFVHVLANKNMHRTKLTKQITNYRTTSSSECNTVFDLICTIATIDISCIIQYIQDKIENIEISNKCCKM